MYKGTYDGDKDEIRFVASFNSNKLEYRDYLAKFSKDTKLWMVRVTTKQYSTLSGRKVFTRSDCYLAYIPSDITELLKANDYFLSEDILAKNRIAYDKIPYSGISVKMTTSIKYQILKTGPNSFNHLFGSYELGAGASLFCTKEIELHKNPDLISGWNSTIERMTTYFKKFTNGNKGFYLNLDTCKKIKNYSCSEIKRMIEDSKDLQSKIFNGVTLYKEPYTAFYIYKGNKIEELTTIPFYVTTGSGRSHGDYSIVLKP